MQFTFIEPDFVKGQLTKTARQVQCPLSTAAHKCASSAAGCKRRRGFNGSDEDSAAVVGRLKWWGFCHDKFASRLLHQGFTFDDKDIQDAKISLWGSSWFFVEVPELLPEKTTHPLKLVWQLIYCCYLMRKCILCPNNSENLRYGLTRYDMQWMCFR